MAITMEPPARADLPADAYKRLEEQVLARDQVGAYDTFIALARAGRPLTEMLRETVSIHAPYTHVPYHQRLDNGLVKFVNNDHCLLSARATLRLTSMMPQGLGYLPMAQTVWYVPTGLDIWNQLLGKAPGHYVRLFQIDAATAGPPQVHWPHQTEPLYEDGSFDERLNGWLTLVQRGEVLASYRTFLGLLEDKPNRQKLLSQLVFAGLIDVQDRMMFNRSYTTGHKSYRARATVELGNAIGWDQAGAVIYAGVPDIAVGPRWYSTYEMAANVCATLLDGKDHDLRDNTSALTPAEQAALEDVILHSHEPAWQYHVTDLLKAGKGPRQILDVIQVASAELIIQCGTPEGYSMPQHSFEYCNTLRWYFDAFDHPHQVKLLYVAASFVNQAAHHQAIDPQNAPVKVRKVRGADGWSHGRLLERLDRALVARDWEASLALVQAYLDAAYPDRLLAYLLATAATKFGNDPHNQEIGLCLVEDYLHSSAADRGRLLLACAKHVAGYRKYGDTLEAYRRYAQAFALPTTETAQGDAPVEDLLLDD